MIFMMLVTNEISKKHGVRPLRRQPFIMETVTDR
jgi:hypothetical protein